MMRKYFIFALLFSSNLVITAQPFQKSVEQLILNSGYTAQSTGVFIKEIETDSVLVSINQDRPYNPASVMKLITGAAAFELLGNRYTFKTNVYIDRKSFDKSSGTINGNLYIRGGGDPGFLAERLWLFVQHLSHRRVKKVTQDLVLDDSYFDTKSHGPGFDEKYSSRAYEAPVAPLSANFNTIAIHVSPGAKVGDPVFVTPFPAVKGVKIVTTAKTTSAKTPSRLEVKTEIMDGKTAILVFGGMSINDKPRYKYRKVWSTWENFGWMIQGLFDQNGIQFSGSVIHEKTPDSLLNQKPFYSFKSEPLPIFVFNMFKYSSNFAAEMIFKTIGATKSNKPGSWENGSSTIETWWKNQKISDNHTKDSFKYPIIKNGSGMGGGNQVSPSQVAALLEYVWMEKEYFPDFNYGLSVAGIDGTLKSRFKRSPLKGIIRAKTGTLNERGVSNLAGYVFTKKKIYIFVVLVNHKKKSQGSHWALQQNILEKVIKAK